jgi:hypothetical protein
MLGIRLTDPIGRLVGDPVATIRSTDTLRDAARGLAAEGLGLLVVVRSHSASMLGSTSTAATTEYTIA